jgi:hypothetical protein
MAYVEIEPDASIFRTSRLMLMPYTHISLSLQPAFNPLNTELNPIFHLLALLEAHHILHVSRIRVKSNIWESDVFILSRPRFLKLCETAAR